MLRYLCVRPLRWVGLILSAGGAALPGTAWSAESSGFALGESADLHLTLGAQVRYDDNLFLASNNEEDDLVFSVAPGIELAYGDPELTHGRLIAAEAFTFHTDNDDENDELVTLDGMLTVLGARSRANFTGQFRQMRENTRDTAAFGSLVRRDLLSATASGEYEFSPKTAVGAGFSYDRTDFVTAGFVDSSGFTVPLNLYYELTPKIDLSAGYRYRRSRQDNFDRTRYTDHFVSIGARGDFTPKLSGAAQLGLVRRSASGGAPSQDTVGLDALVTWAASVRTTWTAGVSRDFQASGLTGESVTNTSFDLRVVHEIATFWSFEGGCRWEKASYTGGRRDDLLTGSINLRYEPSGCVGWSAGLSTERNGSNAELAEFDRNLLSVSAALRY